MLTSQQVHRLWPIAALFLLSAGLMLLIGAFFSGCATAPAYRTASADEVAKYGVKPEARRYEYPDVTAFVQSAVDVYTALDDSRGGPVSYDLKTRMEGNVVRTLERTSSCAKGTGLCTVTLTQSILVLRGRPVPVGEIPSSEVVTWVSLEDKRQIAMLHPTETSLRTLVLQSLDLRDHPPKPGECKTRSITADFRSLDHLQFEQRLARLLEKDGYIPIHAVIEAHLTLADWELAWKDCLEGKARDRAITEGRELLTSILGTAPLDPAPL